MEPKIGVGKIRMTKNPESKIKAFVQVIVPSVCGDITIHGFKAVEGKDGLFISLPSRAVKVKGGNVIDDSGTVIRREEDKTTYYNDITFESKDKFNEFREELKATVLPAVEDRLAKAEQK